MAGLKAAGFYAIHGQPDTVSPGDLLVIWNRYGDFDHIATAFERRGGLVVVAENGYIGADENGVQHYALALDGHNGSGRWHVGGPERFARLGIEPKPWRAAGEHIVVRGQRGIGSPAMASPAGWHRECERRLRKLTARPVHCLDHPGKPACAAAVVQQLQSVLAGAHACVVWSSGAAVRALVEGVPAYYDAPHWICEGAAQRGIARIEQPLMDDALRLKALERMAWAQWSVAEIASGEAFAALLFRASEPEAA